MFDFQILGTQIVEELSSLIDKNVLVTDKNGFVIASTDPVRLNTFHEGASLSMKNQVEINMTKEMCEKLRGVRPGIVMPIIIANTPIGVIGITGKPAEVEKYAKLVRKVAELFITDFMSRQEKERDIREIEFFFFDLITTESTNEAIEDRAKVLNIDSSLYEQVAVIQTDRQLEIADVENLLRTQTVHPDLKIVRWGLEKLVLILPNIPKERLCEGLLSISAKLQKKTKRKLPIGVGKATGFYNIKESFKQAEMAAAISARQNRMVFEEDLKLELLYYSIPQKVQEEYLKRTIAPLLEEKELLHNLEVWIQKKTSLQEVADELHIHKNTLNYRLSKIETILGLKLTNSEDIAVIYTALRLYRKK
ncbi:sugar diacid recognition domain-containing protein [Planomicrobium sp. CPCC 101079]|uniref:CdaR family transcriptional regulator n=1 Tax=Planomicrobium sp. CPCC 101079 TaxID=2599618 RepID=UPI0011B4250B|nr:sugar diacid recognition domain-containing protein [Planomicrobium sp. CPCC 101079]TWT02446.1 hypothetical protein FQV28_13455 [Planomicrobium sp. CPCC 101079]